MTLIEIFVMKNFILSFCAFFFTAILFAQKYPQGYFRNPLDIPMQLVANFGEIRANHWHMGLDIRTNHRVNLPVHAAADGYIARISVEPGGFGQAIYINHPNGYTTLYGHLNAFYPELAKYVKEQQYAQQSWAVNLILPPNKFPVKKGDLIALSGSTGASEGPHVHFEIRDTKTEKNLNPLLFGMPMPDDVPPTIARLAMYDRNKSTYLQSPQMINIQQARNGVTHVNSDKISFAIGTYDQFTGSANHNGVYSARISMDDKPVSEFVLDKISYDDTRYINAQIDYPFHAKGGAYLQHISPLPGARTVAYNTFGGDGMIHLKDMMPHEIVIEVKDANGNTGRIHFTIQYNGNYIYQQQSAFIERLLPNNLHITEKKDFELNTTETSIYDTVNVVYSSGNTSPNAVSLQYNFLDATIPSHDYITVRLKPSKDLSDAEKQKVVIQNTSGSKKFVQKAGWQKGWMTAKFRQFGSYQAFVDNESPTINPVPATLAKAKRIILIPKDNFGSIKSFRAELDGEWLSFSNDKGKSWIYNFDEHFPAGEHTLKVIVEDEAGNVMVKEWKVKR